MGRPGQRRPENQFQHLLDHLCRLDALGLRTGPGHRYKWARKYGIDIQVTQLNDYVESLNQYTAGKFDGCTMTNMDALTVPAASGVDSTALLAGSYSNGNDGIVLKGTGKTLEDLKGQSVHLVQFSVSHYLLARGLEAAGLRERDIRSSIPRTPTSSAPSRRPGCRPW